MMAGKILVIGLGPGKQGLFTLRALEALRTAEAVFVPTSKPNAPSRALQAALPYLRTDQEVRKLLFPMVSAEEQLKDYAKEAAEEILEEAILGKTVAFLCLGDPMLYGTGARLLPYMTKRGLPVEVVPGVSSFSFAAASAQVPLALGDEAFAVYPLVYGLDRLKSLMESCATVVLVKPSKHLKEAIKMAKEMNKTVYRFREGKLEEVLEGPEDLYFSLYIVRSSRSGWPTLEGPEEIARTMCPSNKETLVKPESIEAESFRIVQEGLRKKRLEGLLQGPKGAVLARVIHATADFSFADTLTISEGAAEKGVLALQQGTHVVVDVGMVRAGINKKGLQALGGKLHCFMGDEDVATKAKALGTTRAAIAMQKATKIFPNALYAVGNAPTALLELVRLVLEGKARPTLVIGVPVGFVMAAESKERALGLVSVGIPVITTKGPKGGSSVAVAALNALIRIALEESRHGEASKGQA